jgi:acyl carrier protein
MLLKENIKPRIITIMRNLTSHRINESFASNATFFNDLGLDFLDVVELVMEVEKDFTIAITDEESERIKTLEDIVKLIQDKQRKQGSRKEQEEYHK